MNNRPLRLELDRLQETAMKLKYVIAAAHTLIDDDDKELVGIAMQLLDKAEHLAQALDDGLDVTSLPKA